MEEEGSRKHPVVVDDSSDENDDTQKPAAKRAKTLPIDRKEEGGAFKFSGTRKFILILMVEPDNECAKFLAECRALCSKEVHDTCFQHTETLHFTLFQKAMTYDEAMAISMNPSAPPSPSSSSPTPSSLPVMNLTRFTNWKNCVALETDTSIQSLVASISPSIPQPTNLHLSLYRMRGRQDFAEKKRQFDSVRQHVTKQFGKAQGVRVILKELGSDYFGRDGKFFRVLIDESSH